MSVQLKEGKFFIASVDESQMMNLSMYLEYIVCIYREEEGLSVVFQEDIQEEIDAMSEHELLGPYSMIIQEGKMSEALGLLEKKNIIPRIYSAFNHDHLFVPHERKDDALKALRDFQAKI